MESCGKNFEICGKPENPSGLEFAGFGGFVAALIAGDAGFLWLFVSALPLFFEFGGSS